MKWYVLLLFILIPMANAANIALIVKNSTDVDYVHEYRVNRVLQSMGHNVVLIDSSNYQNYDINAFDAIVIAGRPSNVYTHQHLDGFVASLPVNSKPSVVIDSAYPDDFGWIQPGAIGTVFSSRPLHIQVLDNQNVFYGYEINSNVRTHIIENRPVLNVEMTRSALNATASVNMPNYAVIATSEPGRILLNNQTTSARSVFFGITEPLYWTDEAELAFKNSVNWILHNSLIGAPTQTFTSEYTLIEVNIYNDGTRQFLVDLGKDGIYEKFWDTSRGIITNLRNLGSGVYAIDVDADGKYDYIYNNGMLTGLADLVVTEINFLNDIEEGQDLDIRITVKNTGTSVARNFKISSYFDSTLLSERTAQTVDQNQEYSFEIKIINAPRGQHEIKVIVDPNDSVFERDETNNQMTKSYVLSYHQPEQQSQSSGGSSTSSSLPIIKQQGDINITVAEKIELLQGESVSVDINLHNPLNYPIYSIRPIIEADGLNVNWYKIEPKEIEVIESNQTKNLRLHFTIPENASIYTYKIILKIASSSDFGTRTYSKIMYLQIKEKERQQIEPTVTTTTLPQKQPITGLSLLPMFKWVAIAIAAVMIAIALWFYYPKLRKTGWIPGKGWKSSKKRKA